MKPIHLPSVRRSLFGCGSIPVILAAAFVTSGCGSTHPPGGRLPFSWLEKPPTRIKAAVSTSTGGLPAPMEMVACHISQGAPDPVTLGDLKPGDVIAFHMSHREAWKHLRKGSIQKLPYELFRYGHIALVTPDPSGGEDSASSRWP